MGFVLPKSGTELKDPHRDLGRQEDRVLATDDFGIFYSNVGRPAWVALIRVCTCFELLAFHTPHLNWYMSEFLLHSSAASARLRVLSVYGGAIVMAFSIVTMTLCHWSSQSLCIIAIVVTITHAHSLPHLLPR